MSEFPRLQTGLAEIAQWRAATYPDREAFTFLADGERIAGTLTYGELDLRARAVAGHLQLRAEASPVLLCLPSGLDYVVAFLGCLYAGVLAIPAYPPRNRRHAARIQAIMADSGSSTVLSSGSAADDIHAWLQRLGEAGHADVIDVRQLGLEAAGSWRATAAAPTDVAYLQYTSGSTSTPRGVMVSHENLHRNVAAFRDVLALHPDSVTVSWLPLFHDMGLVLSLVAPVMTGTPVVMMTPTAFVQRPARWPQAVSRFRATHSGAPNFAFDLAVERVTAAQRQELDLSSWRTCFSGSEPIRKATLDRFNAAFAVSGFSARAQVPFLSGMSNCMPWLSFRVMPNLLATNTLYVVNFTDQLLKAPERVGVAMSLLTSDVRDQMRERGRSYAAGLLKFEPSDLLDLQLPKIGKAVAGWKAYQRALLALRGGDELECRKIADSCIT